MPTNVDDTQLSADAYNVLGRLNEGVEVPSELAGRLSAGDWNAIGRAHAQYAPPGTHRYSNIATESGAALGRGTLKLGQVPYDAIAGAAATASDLQDAWTGRGQARPSWADQQIRPGLTGRGLELARLDQSIADNRNAMQIAIADAQAMPNPAEPATFMLPQRTTAEQIRQEYKSRDQQLRARRNELGDTTTLEDLALGAYQTGSKVEDYANRVIPPSAADAVPGERAWYHPMKLQNTMLENVPQFAAQLALAYATGGASSAGGVASTSARLAGFLGSGAAMELADATRSQTEGFKKQGYSELDALKAGAPSAALTAAVNTVLERLDAVGLLPKEAVAREAVKQSLMAQTRSRLRSALIGGASEGLTEMGQELTSAIMESASGANRDALNEGLVPRLVTAGVAGFGPGTVGGAIKGQVEQREATQLPPQEAQTVDGQQPEQLQNAAGPGPQTVTPPAGVVGAEPGRDVASAGQAQSIPEDVAARAKAIMAEAESAGREDASAGTEMADLTDVHPEVARAYRRGFRQGQRGTVNEQGAGREGVPTDGAGAAEAAPAADQARNVAEPADQRAALRGVDEGVAGVVRPGGEAPGAGTGDVGRPLERMSSAELRAEAERLGVPVKGGRWATIERIKEATNARGSEDRALSPAGLPVRQEPQAGRDTAAEAGNIPRSADVRQTAPAVEAGVGRLVVEGGPASGPQSGDVASVNTPPSRLDAIEQAALQRLKTRQIPRGRNVGASIIGAELRDRAIIAAVRVVKAGVRTAEAVHDAVRKVAEELGLAHSPADHERIVDEVKRIVRQAGPDGSRLEEAVAASRARNPDESPQSGGVPDSTVKSRVINTTGQRDAGDAKTVSERKALASNLRAHERAGKAGFAAGVKEGKAKAEAASQPRETLKQRIARTTGMTDAADEKSVSEREALGAAMKAQRRAADRAFKEGRKAAATEFEQQVETIRGNEATAKENRLRLKELVRKLLPPELHKRFLHAIATTRTDKQVDAAATRVLATLADYRTREAVRAADRAATIGRRKMFAENKELVEDQAKRIDVLKEELKAAKAAHVDALQKLDGYRSALESVADATRRAERRAQIETQRLRVDQEYIDRLNKARSELTDAQRRIIEAWQADKHRREGWVEGRKVANDQIAAQTVDKLSGRPAIASPADLETDPNSTTWGKLKLALSNRENVALALGDSLKKLLTEDIWTGQNKVFEDQDRYDSALQEAVEKAGYKWGSAELRNLSERTGGDGADKVLVSLTPGEHGEAREWRGTPGELMYLYAILSKETGDQKARRNIIGGAPVIFGRNRITGESQKVTRADADALVRALDPKLREVVDNLKDWFKKEITPGDAKAYREHHGYDMDQWPGYIHTMRDKAAASLDTPMISLTTDELGGKAPRLSASGMWKDRVERAVKDPYVVKDFFEVMDYMVRTSSARTHLNQTIRTTETILRKPEVRKAVVRAMGKDYLHELTNLLNEGQLVTGKPKNRTWTGEMIRALQRNLARSYLALSPSAYLKNVGGIFKLYGVIPAKYVAIGAKSVASREVQERMMQGSAYLRRLHGQSAASRATAAVGLSSDLLGPPNTKALLSQIPDRKAAVLGELIDRIPFFEHGNARPSIVAWAAHEAMVEDQHPDWSKEKKLEWVAQQTEQAVRRTQNAGTSVDMSRFASNHAQDVIGLMTQFTSDGNASLNLIAYAGRTGGAKAAARAAFGVALNNAWAATITTALTVGLPALVGSAAGNDEEKYRKGRKKFVETMVYNFFGNTAGMVYGGDELTKAAGGLWDSLHGRTSTQSGALSPVGDAVGRVAGALTGTLSAAAQALDDEKSDKQHDKAVERAWEQSSQLGKGALTLVGVPVLPLWNIGRSIQTGATARADRSAVLQVVVDGLKSGDTEEAKRALGLLINGRPEAERGAFARSLASTLVYKGPRGNLTDKEWFARLNAMPSKEADTLREKQADWQQRARALVLDAFRSEAK